MNSAKMLLPLASALLAMSTAAQSAADAKKCARYSIEAGSDVFGLLLISSTGNILPYCGQSILYDAEISLLQKKQDEWVFDMGSSDMVAADMFLQGVTYDAKKGLRIHEIERFRPDDSRGQWDAKQSDAETWDAEQQDAEEPGSKEPGSAAKPSPIGLKLVQRGKNSNDSRLVARFTAPSDGYRLDLVRIVQSDQKRSADIYLFRKMPGEGEGLRDVVENHSVAADLSGVETVRVFFVQGTERRVGPGADWKLLATLTR